MMKIYKLWLLGILLFYAAQINAQELKNAKANLLLPPSQETFSDASEIIVPARESGCLRNAANLDEPDCKVISNDFYVNAIHLDIYESNGNIWRSLSLANEPYHDRKKGFVPLALTSGGFVLRLVKESPNWYEVEINENTRQTEFILKNDPMWAKSDWKHFLAKIINFEFSEDSRPVLLDKPNGKPIEETAEIKWQYLTFGGLDGDWAYCIGRNEKGFFKGWVKWREDRKLLFKPYLGSVKIYHEIEDLYR
ncbi:MAG TPA: hypothetical protein PKY59_19735 [Pyrinomonadaceae bacterium]|nr:hypothetical protein [Pyrinomonadaceae bacterium]